MTGLRRLWEPRGVAVIGASSRAGSLGGAAVGYLEEHGYDGAIYPVNPGHESVGGYPCHPSILDCPGPVDLALVMVAARRVPQVLEECADKGVANAMVLASGFAESGAEGERRQRRMIAVAEERGLRLIGPNCIGLVNPHAKLVAGFSPLFARSEWHPGEIGLVTQSGALGYGIASLALERGLRFSRVINTGNEAAFTSSEVVRDLLEDDCTRVVLVYSEGLRRPGDWPGLAELSRRRDKPVVLLKVGRSEAGARAAASHTAALTGDDAVLSAVCDELGILRVDDIDALLDTAAALAQPRRPAGDRLGVLTTSGGAGVMAADAAADRGLRLPELEGETRRRLRDSVPAFGATANPVDVTAQVLADRRVFRSCMGSMAEDPGIDMLLCCFCVLTGESAERIVEDVLEVAAGSRKPVFVSRTGGDSLAPEARARFLGAGIPVFETPAQGVRGLARLQAFQASRERPRDVAGGADGGLDPGALPAAGEALTERATKALLERHGLPVTRERLAGSPEEAAAAAAELGYPVVLKIESPDIRHKTEVGGVVVGLEAAAAVRAAYEGILESARQARPDARLAGVLVQEQVRDGVEVLLGARPSEFGPVVTVGAGGILVEVMRDVAVRLAPVSRPVAEGMVRGLRAAALLSGARGRPPADVNALVDLVVRVSQLVAAGPDRWELDLNPVLVLPRGRGVRIADALLVGLGTEAAG